MKWLVFAVALAGALASGGLGLSWLTDALRPMVPATGAGPFEPALACTSAAALLIAAIGASVGAATAVRRDPRRAVVWLLVAGIAPGLIDPRAFIVTWLTSLAGLLALSLEPRPARRPRAHPPSWLTTSRSVRVG